MAGLLAIAALIAIAVAGRSGSASSSPAGRARFDSPARSHGRLRGIHKIRHIVIIMQENRSFDNYFGTYPARRRDPRPRRPPRQGAVHSRSRRALRAPLSRPPRPQRRRASTVCHRQRADRRRQDGRVRQGAGEVSTLIGPCRRRDGLPHGKEIPNYWKYAHNFVLQDHMFGSVASWSLPSHLYFDLVVVGALHKAQRSSQLHQRPANRPALPSGLATAPAAAADLRVDRSHLPAAQVPCQLALLHVHGNRALVRLGRHAVVRARHRWTPERLDLVSAQMVRHRPQATIRPGTSSR